MRLLHGDGLRVGELGIRRKLVLDLRGQDLEGAPQVLDRAFQVRDHLQILLIGRLAQESG